MANLKTVSKKSKAQSMGMHTEVLTGRTQQKFFNPDEAENFLYVFSDVCEVLALVSIPKSHNSFVYKYSRKKLLQMCS